MMPESIWGGTAMGKRQPGDHDNVEQRGMFPEWAEQSPPPDSPLTPLPAIDRHTSLAGLALPYRQFLLLGDHTTHTIDCFLSDLRLLARYLGNDTQAGSIQRTQLREWLLFLKWGSEVRPAPKTIARRITFLKNFFGWLAHQGVLEDNPAEDLTIARPQPPLPELLFENELARLVQAAQNDARCHLLILLTLEGGLKKEEILALTPERVDLSDPAAPTVSVRLPDPARANRSRLVALPPSFTPVYQRYLRQYQPQEHVFDCTDRNLTYILGRAVKRAKLAKRVTLQLLRDCFAVRQLRAGLSFEALREKLGLTDETWVEVQVKYRKLAFPA
jgi:site-specific recombinase XerD